MQSGYVALGLCEVRFTVEPGSWKRLPAPWSNDALRPRALQSEITLQ